MFVQKSANKIKILKKDLHFSLECVIILGLTENREQNPGLAKFGIALEWGSRGRWFESSNSDQICENHLCDSRIFLFVDWIRTHLNATVQWTVARPVHKLIETIIFAIDKKANRIQ